MSDPCPYCGSDMLKSFIAGLRGGHATMRGDAAEHDLDWCPECGTVRMTVFDTYGVVDEVKTQFPALARRDGKEKCRAIAEASRAARLEKAFGFVGKESGDLMPENKASEQDAKKNFAGNRSIRLTLPVYGVSS